MTDTANSAASGDSNAAKRERIIIKVRALLAMTTANGCTEEEALTAADRANKLMEDYDLTYTDIEAEVRAERYGNRSRKFAGGSERRRSWHEVLGCTWAIAQYWDCKCWWQNQDLIYFGTATDTEMAHAMTDLLRIAMDGEWARYAKSEARKNQQHVHGRVLRTAFLLGMRRRINARLTEIKAQRVKAAQPPLPSGGIGAGAGNGRALVIVRKEVVESKWKQYEKEADLKLRTKTFKSTVRNGDAYAAGARAGDRVDLGGHKLGPQTRRIEQGA